MDARPKTVRDILHTGDQYLIPFFQRHYSWEKVHWERLRRDIWALMDDDARPVHFLGPLVCTPTAHFPGSVPAYQLIDGQQRLTTLTLLLAAIRDVAASRTATDLAEEISEDYLLHKRRQGTERYKVLPRLGDRQALTAIVEGQKDLNCFADLKVVHGWRYFHRHVQHWARKEAEPRLRKLLDTVSRRLSLVVVTIEGENPYEIFESLNSTGLPLEESDLIRNFVFMQLPLAQQQSFFDEHWSRLEKMFEAAGSEPAVIMTPFYRDYLMRNGRYSREDATFIDFKTHHRDAALTPELLVEQLKHFAALDLMIRRPQSVARLPLRRALLQVHGMDITTAYPLVLHLLDRNHRAALSDDDLCGCLNDLVSFVLRRSICGESTRAYGRWFVEAIAAVKDDPRADLSSYWLARRWPDDKTVRKRISDFAIYRREPRKVRVILEALEEAFGHKERVALGSLSIEHVLPQTITDNAHGRSWQTALGDRWQETHERFVHTLGNLTLTGYNPDLSNSKFSDKRALLVQSHLELNAHFAEKQEWDASSIQARSAELIDGVIRLWPRPGEWIEYIASAEALPTPEGLTGTEKKRQEYWQAMDSRLEERGVPSQLIVPCPGTTIPVQVGETDFIFFEFGFNQQRSRIHVALTLSGELGALVAERLEKEKTDIERELGYQLEWEVTERFSRIWTHDEGVPLWDREDWPVQHDWFGDHWEDFQRVVVPRATQYEREALQEPTIRQTVEKHQEWIKYWSDCASALAGSTVSFNERDVAQGRPRCRFQWIATGILFGAEYEQRQGRLGVYFGVSSSADEAHQSSFHALHESGLSGLQGEISPDLQWVAPYFWASTPATMQDQSDWARQHNWIRETAEKFLTAFKRGMELN